MALFYVDASALVKLVWEEGESAALRAFLGAAGILSSELVLTEVPRAVQRLVADDPGLPENRLRERAGRLVDALALRPLDRDLLAAAGAVAEPVLRTLDAIHVVTALDLHPVDAFVTYDERQAAAARLAGLRTVAPGASRR